MDFDYFYNRDTERFSFYMVPKILITEDLYKNLSSDAKILYACLLERSSLSFKNDWIDAQGRVYIVQIGRPFLHFVFALFYHDFDFTQNSLHYRKQLRKMVQEHQGEKWMITNGNRVQIKRKQLKKLIDEL